MSKFDVLCIGNAIVDIIARCRRVVPRRQRHHQGGDEPDRRRSARNCSIRGWARRSRLRVAAPANTAAGIASFGGRSAYFGKVSVRPAGPDLHP